MIFVRFYVNGTKIEDPINLVVNKTISDSNGASSFTAEFNSPFGKHKNTFNLNDEILIEHDIDGSSDSTIFLGVLETIEFDGEGTRERVQIAGRDYSAILQDRLIQPVAYRDQEVSEIVTDIIANNANEITTNNVSVTGTTIDRITFNHLNVFDAIKQLAETAGFYFFVDEEKDLHFLQRNVLDSEVVLDKTNILNGGFDTEDRDIYNAVWVYGRRILTGYKDNFTADGVGSVFTLTDKPHNTNVTLNGSQIQPGGIEGMDNPSTDDVKYLVDFDKKQIVFTSGTGAGNNVPALNGSVVINYDRGTPILKYRQDNTSILDYGLKTKLIVDKNIQSFEEASQRADTFINENKNPIIEGNLDIKGLPRLDPGYYLIVNLPNFGINSQQYSIVSVSYQYTPENNAKNEVIKVRLNKKVDKFEDTIKQIILNQKALETSELQGYLTNFQSSTEDLAVESHYELWTMPGSVTAFKFQTTGKNLFNSPHAVLGPWVVGSNFLTSGGDY